MEMFRYIRLKAVLAIFLIGCSLHARDEYSEPRLVLVVVVDAFAHSYLHDLLPNMRGGIKMLFEQGVVYTNAYWPHGTVATAPGHVGLSTGAFACDHGVVGNGWLSKDGKKIAVDNDPAPDAAVFAESGFYNYGKSPRNIMAEGFADSFMRQSQPGSKCQVYSFSHKSRAAIATASRQGKAFWLDERTGLFTSSKYYYEDALPDWIDALNEELGISKLNKVQWKLCYPTLPYKYNFKYIDNYQYCVFHESIIGKELPIDHTKEEAYKNYFLMPESNKAIFDAALRCIRENLSSHRGDRMVVFVCPSELDKVAHIFGPQSKEVVDTIYHLDLQLRRFFRDVQKLVKSKDTVIVLTADHGTSPIPELVVDMGYDHAWRLMETEVNKQLTTVISDEFGLSIRATVRDFMICLSTEFDALDKKLQDKILKRLKVELLKYPAVKMVWTGPELDALVAEPNQIEYFIKQQRYPGRSGNLFLQINPYSQLSKYPTGTSHEVPSELDQHVPLVIYRKDIFEKRTVNTKVWMLQFANSLSAMLRVPKPALSTFPILPGLFAKEEVFL
jgi:predicted AlkP superfamily pyrophosphatase or phosphodiesterase